MSKGKRDSYTSEFKLHVALETMKGEKTLARLASELHVHPSQITKWKEQLNGSASAVFGSPARRKKQNGITEAALMEKVGRLAVEVDWLKKKSLELVQEGDVEVEPRGGLVVLARVASAGRSGQLRLRDHREAEDRHGAGLACMAGSVAEPVMETFP